MTVVLNLLSYCCTDQIYFQRRAPGYVDVVVRDMPQAVSVVDEEQEPLESQATEDLPGDPGQDTDSGATGVDPRVVTRVIRNLLDVEARNRAFTQGSTAIFVHICGLLEIDLEGVDLRHRNAKRSLFEKIINQVHFIRSS